MGAKPRHYRLFYARPLQLEMLIAWLAWVTVLFSQDTGDDTL